MSRRPSTWLRTLGSSVVAVAVLGAAFSASARTPIKRMPTYRGDVGDLLDDPAKMGILNGVTDLGDLH